MTSTILAVLALVACTPPDAGATAVLPPTGDTARTVGEPSGSDTGPGDTDPGVVENIWCYNDPTLGAVHVAAFDVSLGVNSVVFDVSCTGCALPEESYAVDVVPPTSDVDGQALAVFLTLVDTAAEFVPGRTTTFGCTDAEIASEGTLVGTLQYEDGGSDCFTYGADAVDLAVARQCQVSPKWSTY